MGAALDIGAFPADQFQVGLVDQPRRVERVVVMPAQTLPVRELPQLVVKEREELIDSSVAAAPQFREQLRNAGLRMRSRHSRLLARSKARRRRRRSAPDCNVKDSKSRGHFSVPPAGLAYRRKTAWARSGARQARRRMAPVGTGIV